jgi:2-polyprenyl-3-methyl-5-hydroxy-6-metoxy-1,4-benzoquinol methylase
VSIKDKIDEHKYMSGIERTVDRISASAEVFTPSELVVEILQYLDPDVYAPGKTVIDPACGDGQFLVGAKWAKIIIHGMAEAEALADLYGVDIMRDNVDVCKIRLGGGTILMGNALSPGERLKGQTEEEFQLMIQLFQFRTGKVGVKDNETPTLF